ncbi:RNA polymerase [Bacteroidia bacterium]|nr:RNA polymerase [Bacteroidia bacterium]
MSQKLFDKNEYSALWISFTKGNNNAFAKIYKSSYRMLYSYGLSFKITDEHVRDIIQDLFLKLYSRPELVKDSTTLRPLLFSAMRNSCINSVKINQRHTKLDVSGDFDLKFSVDDNMIEDNEEQERVKALVEKILASLTVRQREIIYLRFLHQMEYEEISKIMNMTEQAARNLIYRAMEKIRKENPGYDCYILLILSIYCYK